MVLQSAPAGPVRRSRWWIVVALATVATACGGGDDQGAEPSTTEATTPAETAAPSTTASPSTETSAPSTTGGADAGDAGEVGEVVNADPVVVNLDDFAISIDTTVFRAGTVNFEVTNTDDVPHEFGVTRGDSYEELPLEANGAIDEEALGADLLGKTGALFGALGTTREISFDLTPGNYVFFCNLGNPVSHAARGQVLSVTVVE